MAAEEKVLIIRKKLEKMIRTKSVDQALATELLKALQDIPITLELIQKTKIGLTVNSLRKESTNEETITQCKNMIKTWKKLLSDSSKMVKVRDTTAKENLEALESPETAQKAQRDGETRNETKIQEKEIHSDSRKDECPAQGSSKRNRRKHKRRHRRTSKGDEKDNKQSQEQDVDSSELVRLKCREMLADALKTGDSDKLYVLQPSVLAQLIEQHIFEEFKDTGSKYKNRVRSRVANLKNIKHPALKENVLQGVISPERFAKMTAEEMASNEMKDLRARLTQEAINDHQMGMIDGTVSDLFSCEKCGSNKCTYKQVQLLCSDEPMTTFLLCYSCGYRWSFC